MIFLFVNFLRSIEIRGKYFAKNRNFFPQLLKSLPKVAKWDCQLNPLKNTHIFPYFIIILYCLANLNGIILTNFNLTVWGISFYFWLKLFIRIKKWFFFVPITIFLKKVLFNFCIETLYVLLFLSNVLF